MQTTWKSNVVAAIAPASKCNKAFQLQTLQRFRNLSLHTGSVWLDDILKPKLACCWNLPHGASSA